MHDLRISLLFQLFKSDIRSDASLLLLNGRALNGLVVINGGIIVQLAQAAAPLRGQILAALVQKAVVVGGDAKPAHELAGGGKRGRLPVEPGGHIVLLRIKRFQVVRDLVAVKHRVVLVQQQQRGHAVHVRRQDDLLPIFQHDVPRPVLALHAFVNAHVMNPLLNFALGQPLQ